MSYNARDWAEERLELDAAVRWTLFKLADYAHPDGTAAFPSIPGLAGKLRISESTVRRHLRELEKLGYIRRGDQGHVSHYPGNRRPIVWDLNLRGRPVDNPADNPSPGVSPVTPQAELGVSSETARGVTGSTPGVSPVTPKPSTNPSTNPELSLVPAELTTARASATRGGGPVDNDTGRTGAGRPPPLATSELITHDPDAERCWCTACRRERARAHA